MFSDISRVLLFKNLDQKTLAKIAENARIKTYKKNSFLFLEGDEMKSFFFLLDGQLKLTALDLDGCEAILHIINSEEFVHDVFSKNFSLNCQALTNAKLLILPLKFFQNLLAENSNLSLAFLNQVSNRSQKLLKQLSGLKLSSAKDKLGKFLLESSFEKEGKAKKFDLKTSKAAIASYLGIKPETFSRVLKKISQEGEIAMNKNSFSLKKKESLCRYCDSQIATKCKDKNEDFCTQNC